MDALLNDRYRLIEQIGAGGMAQVYKAQDTLLERPVAIKVLRPQYAADEPFLARFRQEARLAANLSHPNIVAVYDVGEATLPGESTSRPYIVMEFVAGRSLKAIIEAEAPLSVARALDVAAQIAQALAHAHQAGLIHRDVKPQNVLVTHDGRVKVTDFGIARALAVSSISEAGVVLGTVHYLSPEQAAGEPATPLSDVYALGVILYEVLTGQVPFTGETPVSVAVKHLQEAPVPPRELNPLLPPPVEDLILQAMEKDPARRFASAQEMAAALVEYRDFGQGATTAQRPARRPARRVGVGGLSWTSVALGGGLALALMAAALVGWQAAQPSRPTPTALVIAPTATPAPPAPTATPLPAPVVPHLVGQPVDEARRLVEALGLRLAVTEWRYDEQVAALCVIAQGTPAGRPAVRGDVVPVIASRGSARVTVPAMVGRSADEARVILAQRGLLADVTWVWHDRIPSQRVLSQSPPAGADLLRGDKVRLTASSGLTVRLDVSFAHQVLLTDAEVETHYPGAITETVILPRFAPGETIALTLWWQAQTDINKDYVASVQVLDAAGRMVVQQDNPPGHRPTTLWLAGDVVRDDYRLRLPADARPGAYRLVVSLYQSGVLKRLPATAAQGRAVGDSVLVKDILVIAP